MSKRLLRVTMWLLGTAAVITLAGFAFLRTSGFGAVPSGERQVRIEASPNWRDGKFHNAQPQWLDLNTALREAFFWRTQRQRGSARAHCSHKDRSRGASSVARLGFAHHLVRAFLDVDGVRVLTGPFWGERASPVSFFGPKPWFTPPIALNALPPIDAVVISHDHFDHLDRATIEGMREWRTVFVVPLGVGAHLERWGITPDRIRELDWWQSTDVHGLAITATPARHATGRRSSASSVVLWAGYALIGKHQRVWYSGDSSFHEDLRVIGERLGPFDITLTDSGQYNEHWPDVHFGPELAVQAHKLVHGKRMIPVHWALLNLSPHTWTEPVERTLTAAACQGVDVLVLRPGEPTEPRQAVQGARWWPALPWASAREKPLLTTRSGDSRVRYTVDACGDDAG